MQLRRRGGRRILLETLEARHLMAFDFGDAPDGGVGTGQGNYQTSLADNGARHTIVAGLFLGSQVDGEPDSQVIARPWLTIDSCCQPISMMKMD